MEPYKGMETDRGGFPCIGQSRKPFLKRWHLSQDPNEVGEGSTSTRS